MIDWVRFRKLDPTADMDKIYHIYSDYQEQHNLFAVRGFNSPERFPTLFERRLSNNYADFTVMEDLNGTFAGFLIAYDHEPNDGHLKVMVYTQPEFRRCGFAALAAIKYLDVLFSLYNLRKIYVEVYGYNLDSKRFCNGFGLICEARLSKYRYYKGRYWDFLIYAIDRGSFYDRYESIL